MFANRFQKWCSRFFRKNSARSRRISRNAIECLEERVLLAYVQVLQYPTVNVSGDGLVVDQTRLGGTSEDAGALFQIQLSAGQGPRYPEVPDGGRWGTSAGQYTLQGSYTFKIEPENGEVNGTPIKVALHSLFSTSGGTGARVSFNPGGHTDVSYQAIVTGGTTASPTLFDGQQSAELIDQSPTGQIVDFDLAFTENRIIETTIGQTIRISTNITGSAATWQGGATGLARGSVDASLSYRISLEETNPDLSLTAATNLEQQRVDVGYSYSGGDFGTTHNSSVELYWQTGSGQRIGLPFYTAPIALRRANSGTVAIPLSVFNENRPSDAVSVLFVAADPTDPSKALGESDLQNNFASINLIVDPTVDLVFRPRNSISAGLHEKEDYDAYAIVRNNSLVPITYTIDVEQQVIGSPPPGLTGGELSGFEVIEVPPLTASDLVFLGSQKYDWDWINPENPMTFAKFGEAVGSEAVDFAIGKVPVVGGLYELYDAYDDLVKPFLELSNELRDFPDDVFTQIRVEYQARVSGAGVSSSMDHSETVDVSVPPLRQAKLRSFYVLRAFASAGVAYGAGAMYDAAFDFNGVEAAIGAGVGLTGMATWVGANRDYEAAKDPPDANFMVLAVPQPVEAQYFSEITDASILAIARRGTLLLALQQAQQDSRDRADGAREAHAPTWEATQLLAASDFANQRTLELLKQGVLQQLFSEYYAGPNYEIPANTAQLIAQNGIPQRLQTIMQEFGYTAEDIQDLRDYFAVHGIEEMDPLEQWGVTVTRLAESGVSAMTELQNAINVRTSQLGQAVSDVAPGVLRRLDQLRTDLTNDFNPGRMATADLPGRLASYIDEVRSQVLATNNYATLKEYLDFGYGSLVRYIDNDWRTQSLSSKINQFKTAGEITPALAASLTSSMNAAHTALEAGLFSDAATHFNTAFTLVISNWGNGVASSAAYPLAGAFSQAAGLLATGNVRALPTAGVDDLSVRDGVATSVSVLQNDSQATAGQVRLLWADQGIVGGTSINNNNTPANPVDDKVVYTSSTSFTGHDRVYYYVINSDNSAVVRGEVNVTRALTPGTLETRTVNIIPQSYTFQAEADVWYQLDTASLAGDMRYEVISPDGQTLLNTPIIASGRTVFRTSAAGPYEVRLTHFAQGSATITFRLVDLSDIPILAHDTTTAGTLPVPTGGSTRSDVFYRLRVNTGEAAAVVIPQTNSFAFGVQLYQANGAPAGFADRNFERLYLPPDQTTEYLVVAQNRNSETPLTAPVNYQIEVLAPPVTSRTIAIGEVVEGTTGLLGQIQYLTFEGTAGQRILIDSGTDEDYEVTSADGMESVPTNTPYLLTRSGQFVIEVRGGLLLKNYRLKLVDLSSQPTVNLDTVVTGSLSRPAPLWEPDDRVYRFLLHAGDRVALDPLTTVALPGYQAIWRVFSPAGDEIINEDFGERFLIDAEETGEYLFQLRSAVETSFSFQLIHLDTDPVVRPFALGELIDGEIDVPGRTVRYEFEGTAGQVFYFDTYETDFDPIISRLIAPDGTIIRFANADLEGMIALPANGIYHLDFSAQEAYVGEFQFRLSEVENPLPAAFGVEIEGAITAPRSTLIYSFTGQADQRLLFKCLEAFDISGVVWTLYSATGETISRGTTLATTFAATLPQSGDYYLVFDGLRSDSLATFTFKITEPETTELPLSFDTYISGELVGQGTRIVYTFNGTAGQLIYFDSLDFDIPSDNLVMRLTAPDGTLLGAVTDVTDGPVFLLPENGEYRLSITDSSVSNTTAPQDYLFQLIDISASDPLVLNEPRTAVLQYRLSPSQQSTEAAFRLTVPANSQYRLSAPEIDDLSLGVLYDIFEYDPVSQKYVSQGGFGMMVSELNLSFDHAGEYVIVVKNNELRTIEFDLVLTEVPNTPPEIYLIPDVVLTGGMTPTPISFAFADEESESEHLTFTVTSSNPGLIPASAIIVDSEDGTLTIHPAAGQLGMSTITVTVTDELGLSDSVSFTLRVANRAPTLLFSDDFEGATGEEITFEVPAYDEDVDEQTLQFSLQGAPSGATIDPLTGVFHWTPSVIGEFTFTFTVSDGFQSDSETVTATIVGANHAPTGLTLSHATIAENSPAETIVGTLLGIDPDLGDTLFYNLVSFDSPFELTGNVLRTTDPLNFEFRASYTLEFEVSDQDDLTFTKFITVTVTNVNESPTNLTLSATTISESSGIESTVGTLSATDPDAGNTFTFSLVTTGVPFSIQENALKVNGPLNASSTPSYPLTIRVTDAAGLTFDKTVTVTVTPGVNQAPTAVSDTYTINEDEVLSGVNVLSNDTDPEQNTLTAEKLTNPSHGTVSLAANGALSYTPDTNYFGTDSFTYRARDSQLASSTVTVTITINSINDAPVGSPDSYIGFAGTPLTITAEQGVLANDHDVENSPLTASVATQPIRGTLSLAANGGFVYTPSAGYQGPDSFTYRASDGTAESEAITVSLQVNAAANHAPTDLSLTNTTIAENSPSETVVGTLSGTDPDAGDTFTFSLVTTDVPFSIQGNALKVTGLLNAATTASYPLTIRVTDAAGLTFDKIVTVTVTPGVNQAPTGVSDTYTINEDGVLSGVNVLSNDTDPEQNTLTAEKLTNPSHGTVSLATNGAFSYTPEPNYVGTDSFTYRASDSQLTSATVTVTITINSINDAPVGGPDSYIGFAGTPLTITAAQGVLGNDHDVENSPLTASVATQPVHGTLSLAANGGFVYTPAAGYQGPDSFTYRASDGTAESESITVSLQVNAGNRPPVVAPQTVNLTTAVKAKKPLATVSVADPDPDQSFTYAIQSGNGSGIFAVASNGVISIPKKAAFKKALKTQTTFPLTIRVTDNGNPAASATGAVTFVVIPKTRGRAKS